MKTIVTHHGPDYDRLKWGTIAKSVLRIGEWCAAKFSNEIIVISQNINLTLIKRYNRKNAHLIYNGVNPPALAIDSDYILELGLVKHKYIIAVGRFVPEKGWHDLITALPMIDKNYKLVFVGDADHPSSYSMKLKEEAEEKGVVLTGYIKGEKLHQIYSHAALFVLPSYHEGLPISLLEAMSYNLNVVVSNIPANAEVDLPESNYFEVKNVDQLAERINENLNTNVSVDFLKRIKERYNWDDIAENTYQVFKEFMKVVI
jgi:glycosyltransferase involved in cell wall biosynthesis